MYNSQSGSYDAANTMTMTYEETGSSKKKGILFVIFGWLFAAVSFLFIPILFGTLGFLMGFLTYHERSQIHGILLMFFSAAGLILGSLLSFVVAGTLFI